VSARAPSGAALVATLAMLLALLLYGIPGIFMITTSLRTNAEVYAQAFSVNFAPTFDAFLKLGDTYDMGAALWASIRITAVSTVLVLVLGVPAAYALARLHNRLGALTLSVLILLQLLPASTLVIPLYQVLRTLGLLGSISGVILAVTAYYLPFAILLMRPFFLNVPSEVEDAAELDGASRLVGFLQVVMPIARNGVITVGVLVAMIVWGDFMFPLTLLVDPADYPLNTLLAQQVSDFGVNWPRLMALAVTVSIPVVLLFLLMERRLSAGLSMGAIK
jgi:multiple sugar transport system permease protein